MGVQNVQLKRGDTAYVSLTDHRQSAGSVARTVKVDDLLPDYSGPRIHLDFDADGKLVGIEVLA